jgi:hypothetical protein
VTSSFGSRDHLCSLVHGRLSHTRVPIGLPITFRALHLLFSDAEIATAAALLQDERFFPAQQTRDWLAHIVKPFVAAAPHYDVRTAGEFFALMQYVAQVASATDPVTRRLRAEMDQLLPEAEQFELDRSNGDARLGAPPSPSDAHATQFIASRPDEEPEDSATNSFLWQSWHVSFASAKGPIAGDKLENQDAVLALPFKSALIFALCDGVSTSYGARYAAAWAAATFCFHASQRLRQGGAACDLTDTLRQAAALTYGGLTALLDALVDDEQHPAWPNLRSGSQVPRTLERKLCENTREPHSGRSWAPVLATTLIGGVLQPDHTGAQAYFLRLGDGVVEVLEPNAAAVPVLPMDADEMAIDNLLCPGPRGRASIEGAEVLSRPLSGRQSLVVSSDGLVRGITGSLSDALCVNQREAGTARVLLREACDRANQVNERSADHIYADNLSLLYLRSVSDPRPL